MFINPMWFHESQRIGKQKCTPTGYMLHGISDLIGFVALICLIGVLVYMGYLAVQDEFTWSLAWLLLLPFAVAIAGNILHSYSWHLAEKRQFKFNHETCISTWVDESGAPQSYQFKYESKDAR